MLQALQLAINSNIFLFLQLCHTTPIYSLLSSCSTEAMSSLLYSLGNDWSYFRVTCWRECPELWKMWHQMDRENYKIKSFRTWTFFLILLESLGWDDKTLNTQEAVTNVYRMLAGIIESIVPSRNIGCLWVLSTSISC